MQADHQLKGMQMADLRWEGRQILAFSLGFLFSRGDSPGE
jgi:hypothetical protein